MTTGALASSVLQDAAFDALNVAAFTALSTGGVFTDVPQDTAFPYTWLAFGDPAEDPVNETFGRLGVVVHLEVQAFSDYQGDDQVIDILDKAAELLHHVNLTVTGWAVPYIGRTVSTIQLVEINGVPVRIGTLRLDAHLIKS